eukprot:Pgem_evm1s8812
MKVIQFISSVFLASQIQLQSSVCGHKIDRRNDEMVCASTNSETCLSEYNNHKNDDTLDLFYNRCKTEGGKNSIRTYCAKCCEKGGTISVFHSESSSTSTST